MPSLGAGTLALVAVVNFLDRQVLGILLPQIRAEFHLSDTALGLLSGLAFALVYGVLGVPFGVLADSRNRQKIIAASLAVFSLATLGCGLAGNFAQLIAARFFTGVGEAGASPAVNSMISDIYPPDRRAGALSIYSAGANIGLILAFFGGGWIAQHEGWRAAFLASGALSLLVIPLVLWVAAEPAREGGIAPGAATAILTDAKPSLRETISTLWALRSFRFVAIGMGLASMASYSALVFIPSFLTRSYHMTPITIGVTLALVTGVIGAAGASLPGVLADRLGKGDIRAGLLVASAGTLCSLPFIAIFYLAGNLSIALGALIVPAFFSGTYLGPGLAAVQNLAPPRMRGQGAAILLLILNLIGLGVGPQLVGVLSDLLRPTFGEESLRYALLSTIISSAAAAWCFWRAGLALANDARQTEAVGLDR